MTTRLNRVMLALAVSGLAASAWAQSAPDGAPAAPGGPDHSWHHGERDRDGGYDEGRSDDEWGDGGGHGHFRHHMGGHGVGHHALARAFHDLDLTREQQLKMRTIVAAAHLQALQQEAVRKPGDAPDMAALMNPGDPNYGNAVQAAKKRAADHIQRISDLKLQLYNVLTPEQKTKFAAHIAARKARMARRAEDPKGPPAPAAR